LGRTIWVLAVVVAFVAGSIITGTLAFADPDDDEKNPFKKIVNQLKKIVKAIEGIDTITGDQGIQGEQGDQGIQGEQGETGLTGSIQVYEVSGISVIPPVVESGDEVGSPVQLRCLDGDWFLKTDESPRHSVVLSTNAIPVDRTDIRIIGEGNFVLESEAGIEDEFEKTIGWDGFAKILFLESITFSDIPVTITGLCLSPSP